jgi:flagellar motor component MotA
MPSFAFGGSERERIEVQVHDYVPEHGDGQPTVCWVPVSVLISVGAFSGRCEATFQTSEFVAFRNELQALHQSLEGSAHLDTIERQLDLKLTCDRFGRIALEGVAEDKVVNGNRLEFSLTLDQSYLPSVLDDLHAILETFPPSCR